MHFWLHRDFCPGQNEELTAVKATLGSHGRLFKQRKKEFM